MLCDIPRLYTECGYLATLLTAGDVPFVSVPLGSQLAVGAG